MSHNLIALRITMDEIPEDLWNYLKMKGCRLAAREGDGSKQAFHYHMYLEGNLETVRKYLRRKYKGGNKLYSIATVRFPYDYMRYICKGEGRDSEPTIMVNDGYDTHSLHNEYWSRN